MVEYCDLLYETKNYKEEADLLHFIIQEMNKTDENTLLDVAYGTGRHIEFLKKHYSVVGFDLNEEMLGLARERNSDVVFIQGD